MIENASAMDRPLDTRRARRMKRIRLALLVLVPIVLAALFYPTISNWFRSERSVALSRVRIGEVVRGDLEREVSVQGRIVAAFHPTTSSPAAGIVSLRVRAGEVVNEGQVLADVDSPELQSRLEQERSSYLSQQSELERQRIQARQTRLADRQEIDLAVVELEAAERAMERAERSRGEGIINDVEYEEAQDNLSRARVKLTHARENAELERDTLEFEIRNRELQLDRQRLVVEELRRKVNDLAVRAPVGGLVSRLDVEDHDAVTPGQPLVAVVDLSAFEIEIQVPEAYADEITPGTPAIVTVSGEDHSGAVRGISPEVEGSQVKGIVTFTGDPPEGLRQNQRVSTRLVFDSRLGVLKVPRGPFLEGGGGHRAYVIDGNLAELREIRVGVSSVTDVEIVSGLEEGDRIIISDITRFREAERVFLKD
jgi:HlyD family secretion protein